MSVTGGSGGPMVSVGHPVVVVQQLWVVQYVPLIHHNDYAHGSGFIVNCCGSVSI